MSRTKRLLLLFTLAAFTGIAFLSSSALILDLFSIRSSYENLVWFLVWSQWFSSLFYALSFFRIYKNKDQADKPLFYAESVLLINLLYLGTFGYFSGLFMAKTVGLIVMRLLLTLGIHYFIRKKDGSSMFWG
jgi:hypothetical protein